MTGLNNFDRFLKKLEVGPNKIVGIYEQGSWVEGLADEYSDRDFTVIWEQKTPSAERRVGMAIKLGAYAHEFKDIPAVKKGVDAFDMDNTLLNVAHIKGSDFFNFFKGVTKLGKYYEEQLLRLGGFKYGTIHYDPKGRLTEHQKTIVVTPEIITAFKDFVKHNLEHYLKALDQASKRVGFAYYIYILNKVIEPLRILGSLNMGYFPPSIKWYETITQKRKYQDPLTGVLLGMNKGIDKKVSTEAILKIAKDYGFKPSSKITA